MVWDHMSQTIWSYKSEAFREEEEWRIMGSGSGTTRFRHSDFGVIPYRAIPLEAGSESPICEIYIGPTPYPDEAERAMTLLLQRTKPHE
jgi:hypothetical protein